MTVPAAVLPRGAMVDRELGHHVVIVPVAADDSRPGPSVIRCSCRARSHGHA